MTIPSLSFLCYQTLLSSEKNEKTFSKELQTIAFSHTLKSARIVRSKGLKKELLFHPLLETITHQAEKSLSLPCLQTRSSLERPHFFCFDYSGQKTLKSCHKGTRGFYEKERCILLAKNLKIPKNFFRDIFNALCLSSQFRIGIKLSNFQDPQRAVFNIDFYKAHIFHPIPLASLHLPNYSAPLSFIQWNTAPESEKKPLALLSIYLLNIIVLQNINLKKRASVRQFFKRFQRIQEISSKKNPIEIFEKLILNELLVRP